MGRKRQRQARFSEQELAKIRAAFEAFVPAREPGACWIWKGKTVRGYGSLTVRGRSARAHRISWVLHNGPIRRRTHHVLHNCPGGDNPSCVNPAHLWLGTHQQNMADKCAKGRQPHGDTHHNAKLSFEKARFIHYHHVRGVSYSDLAFLLDVSQGLVGRVVTGERWIEGSYATRHQNRPSRAA